jgi:uncharacterized repeat protein (TIGR01451 family)
MPLLHAGLGLRNMPVPSHPAGTYLCCLIIVVEVGGRIAMARFTKFGSLASSRSTRQPRRKPGRYPHRRRHPLWLEQLEDRLVPSTFKPDLIPNDQDAEAQDIQNDALFDQDVADPNSGPSSGQSEMAIAADPTGQHVVIGFNDFQGFNNNPLSVSGFAYSDDAGAHFTYGGQLPSTSNGHIGTTLLPQVVGDPVLAYVPGGSGGQFVYASIEVIGRGGSGGNFTGSVQTMCVHTSTDFGHTWSGPFEVTPASNPHGVLSGQNARDAADKEWIAVDPDTGRVMMVWSNFTSTAFIPGGREISATYTDNAFAAGGPTWSARQILNPGATTQDQASNVAFAGNGSNNVYVAWSSTTGATGAGRTRVVVSSDNGASFGPPQALTPSEFYQMDQVLGNDRVHQFPSVAVDNSTGPHQGNVYIVYADNDHHDGADIMFQRSTDGGASFSPGILLDARPGNDRAQWFPSVSVDSTTGRVSVIYLDQGVATSGDLTEVSWTYSDDGGVTWSRPSSLTSPGAHAIGSTAADAQPFHAGYGNDTSQPNMGDYINSVSIGGNLYATWGGTSHLGNYQDGQPTSSFTNPDFYFNKTSAPFASLHAGTATVSDSGGDGFIDPGELIQLTLPLTNYVTNPVFGPGSYTGVTATLTTSTPGVVVTQGTVAYPDIAPGATQSNALPFKVAILPSFVPGSYIEFSLSVTTAQGSTTLLFTQVTGTPVGTTIFSENFDGVAAGTLPAGWATIHQGGGSTGTNGNIVPWTTSTTRMNATSNGLFHTEANDQVNTGGNQTRFERVSSPLITIPVSSQYVTLDFDISFDLEDDNSPLPGYTGQNILAYDGADLRITDFTPGHFARANQVEAFEQSFTTDGYNFYNKHLPRSSNTGYFQDQSVWSGSSQGFVHVHMVLPGMGGTTVQLRWDYTQDSGGLASDLRPGALNGVMIDNIVMKNVVASTTVATADLTVTKTHTGDFLQGQSGANYTITVSNNGTGVTSGTVSVADLLPAGLTATAFSGAGWVTNLATLTATRSDLLAPGDSYAPLTLTVDVDSHASPSVTNTATVSGGGEVNTGNDTATDPTTINQIPRITSLDITSPINEDDTATISGTFVADAGDTHTVVITWGAGEGSTTLTLGTGVGSFSTTHQYVDNLPGDAPYSVGVTVTDNHGLSDSATTSVVVNNVAPTAGVSGPSAGVRAQTQTFSLSALDPSPVDQAAGFVYSIDWGDGSPIQIIARTPGNGSGTTADHVYTVSGTYTVSVTATDKDNGTSAAATQTIVITAIGLQPDPCNPGGTMLVVGGTSGDDVIVIAPGSGGAPAQSTDLNVTINGVTTEVMAPAGGHYSRVVVYAGDGNDDVTQAGSITVPGWLYGGNGNDRLKGGSGDNVIVGGAGDDLLVGGNGRDFLIGGTGSDRMIGGGGDDILIGGYTSYDANDAALCALMAEWTSNDSFAVRVARITDSSATYHLINGQTVFDDASRDQLTGSSGSDLFYYGTADQITDLSASDRAFIGI